ncbi:MAG TPA: alpha-amylase family glycosyl hydrolase, partial [Saprospiraceae bacterium]|nr:alpha-amylase family glycosyl hydrolase [Saprospiraceae bacterium]
MRHHLLASLFSLFLAGSAFGQNLDITMQAWYWDYFQNGNFGNWINQLNGKAAELQEGKFKHIWLPPLSRSSNADNMSNGYNPRDLYDFGEYGGACAWGTRAQLNTLISNYNSYGLKVVSDMIYNHRDGGLPEKNEAVRYFVTTPSNTAVYPSDRFFCVLPLGSANPGQNGAGDYYLKIKSKTNGYNSNKYKFYAKTSLTTYQGQVNETEPNGGLDCGSNPPQGSQTYALGQDLICTLGPDALGCHIDEIKITLNSGDFNPADDTLWVYLTNYQSGYSDHFVYGLWSTPRSQNIVSELEYFTYTDFTDMPSGQGSCNYNVFRPNDNSSNSGGVTETLGCDWNCPLFFYDYDQSQQPTEDLLNAWTKWQINTVGIKGLRMDAVKHFDPAFVGQLMDYLDAQNALPDFAVGEYFDYTASVLKNWVEAVDANMAQTDVQVRAFDFALRSALKSACDQFGYDVRNIFNSGMVDAAGANQFKVVTFVDNHDLRHEGNYISNDARLAYAYILTNNQIGAPCVFYPDYFGGSVGGAPNIMLKSRINALNQLHETYIYQSADVDYLSRFSTPYCQFFVPNGNNGSATTSLIYQLKPNSTGKAVIVAINFSGTPLDMYQCINTSADWGGAVPGTTFTDMLGYSGGLYTDITNSNEIHVTLPARSYTVYVQGQNTPLPVELSDFQAIAETDRVLLRWSAATERHLSHYDIERSVGKNAPFTRISTVSGKNALAASDYTHYDEQPVYNQPLYYRLRMVDADGSASYSPLRTVTLQRRDMEAYLAPNPGREAHIYLNLKSTQALTLRVTDAQGRPVHEQHIEAEA